MATFQAQIEDLVGTISDTAALTTWLTEGGRIAADIMAAKGSDKIQKYTQDKADAGSGVAITGGIPLSAHKSGYPARRIVAENYGRAGSSSSIHQATATDPAWYIDASKGYVLPSGGTIRWFAYPSVAYGASSVSNYPPEAYSAFIYYAAVQAQVREITDLIKTTISAVTFSLPTIVATPSAPSFTWTDAVIGTYSATALGVTAVVPTYTKPTFGGSYTNIETRLSNADLAWTQAEGVELNLQLNQYGQDIQNEVGEYQKELAAYQGKIQQEIEQARLTQEQVLKLANDTTELNKFNELQTLAEQIQEYQAVLGKHQSDVANYSAQVQKEVARIQTLIQQYTTMYTGYFKNLEYLQNEYKRILETL